jgi:hypothetical protein
MITESKLTDNLIHNWYKFRQELEVVPNPLESTVKYFLSKPKAKFYTDPYDQSTWPTPWELITENEYCPFNLILGICYTLQLTERFNDITPTIAIAIDNNSKEAYYLLIIKDQVFGYSDDEWTTVNSLPNTLTIKKKFEMERLH